MVNQLPEEGYYLTSPKIPNFFVWVEIDDKPVQVYSSMQLENGKVQGFIEAIEGKEFKVRYADLRTSTPGDSFTNQMYLDGTSCRSQVSKIAKHNYRSDPGKSWRYKTWSGKRTSRTTEQPFLFGKLQTTDEDDAACSDENVIKNLGTIQIKYHRVTNLRACQTVQVFNSTEPKPIHEQSKKARLSHQAAFGETKQIPLRKWITCDWIDSKENPLQTYEFRYLSRRLLQLEGHVPNSPTPSPSPPPVVARPVGSPSPAQTPDSPVASTSNTRRSASATAIGNETQRLARLREELESLRRQERIAALRQEIAGLEGNLGAGPSDGSSSSTRRIKDEPVDGQGEAKRIKREVGEASLSQSTGSSKGKGKAKAEVLVLSDSD